MADKKEPIPQTVYEWLNTPCPKEEVKGDADSGFFLGIDRTREKIKFMEDTFGVSTSYFGFSHLIFTTPDRQCFTSGSLNVKLTFADGKEKHLVGAATFNIQDYYPNQHFAATLKSLCICNALFSEYPQFGSLLNKEPELGKEAPPVKATKETVRNERIKLLIDSCAKRQELIDLEKSVPKEMREYYDLKLKQIKK